MISRPPVADLLLVFLFVASVLLAFARTMPPVVDDVADTAARGTLLFSAPSAAVRAPMPAFRRSPFRLGGAFDQPVATEVVSPPPAVESLPTVGVKAIVGPPWQAVLSGLPGVNGDRVVRLGDRFGPVEVRGLGADWVVLKAADTSWTIVLKARRQ